MQINVYLEFPDRDLDGDPAVRYECDYVPPIGTVLHVSAQCLEFMSHEDQEKLQDLRYLEAVVTGLEMTVEGDRPDNAYVDDGCVSFYAAVKSSRWRDGAS
jgi:hypothetical protein